MPNVSLETFRGCHAGADIYILASGSSVDFIHPDFFKGKITIGINEIYKIIPSPNYLVRKDPERLLESIRANPTIPHFISVGQYGARNTKNRDFVVSKEADISGVPVILFEHNTNTHKLPATLPEEGLIVSHSTIVTAIHLAALMGAANILLVGHDCGTLDGKVNCSGYYTQHDYNTSWKNGGERAYRNWVPTIENDTIQLKGLLKERYGCNVYSINPFINFGLEGHTYSK